MTWERYAADIFDVAKQSSPSDRFTEEARTALIEWASREGVSVLSAAKEPYDALRRKLAELAGIPLRDSSGRKSKPKRGTIMSSSPSPDKSPFDDLAQPAHVPNEMSARISVQEVNTAEPGPYYVYIPGIDAEGLKDMLHALAYSKIPAGEVFRIGAIEESMLAGRLDQAVPHKLVTISNPITQKVVDRLHVIAIPASTTLRALQSDRSVTQHVLSHIAAFDKLDIEHQTLNDMIRPKVRQPDGSTGPILELTKPEEWRKEIDAIGMLALRMRWLNEAAEKLETGRMLEEHRRIIDARPFLRDTWLRAIKDVLIPANDQFRIVAETRLSAIEDRMRNPQNSDNYDRYSFKIMWLLGRQPARSALERTLDSSNRGGLSPEEVKLFVANEIARQQGTQAAAAPTIAKETMQCPDCGEDIRTVNGGPPRICRHCRYEFRQSESMNQSRESVVLSEEPNGGIPVELTASMVPGVATKTGQGISKGVQAATSLDSAFPLAEGIVEGAVVEAAPAGEGLSPEDESEIEDMAANILRG